MPRETIKSSYFQLRFLLLGPPSNHNQRLKLKHLCFQNQAELHNLEINLKD